MRESREYLNYLKQHSKLLIAGLVIGLVIGFGVMIWGGKLWWAGQSLELEVGDLEISQLVIISDESVAWIRESAKSQDWVEDSAEFRAYKEGPLMVRVEVKGSDKSAEMVKRVNQQLVMKYGYREVTAVQERQVWRYEWFTWLLGGLAGFGSGLLVSLLGSYWRNF